MSYQVHYYAFGRELNDVWLGAPPAKIERTIMEICPTANIISITPIKTSEDELSETHTQISTEDESMAIYREPNY